MIRMRLLLVPVLVLLLLNSSARVGGSRVALKLNHRDQCEALVKRWAEKEIWAMEEAEASKAEKWQMEDLLFFLHVPRTGGRNYNQCFLKNLFTIDTVCPRSYDILRLDNPSKPNCSFLSTHDDYSIVSKLPRARTSTITNLRDPSGRVLSSYEFSLEVAARFLKRNVPAVKRVPIGPHVRTMNTLDIWPWKYLVPLMQRDLFQRRDSRASGAFSEIRRHPPTVYDAPAYVMPLKEYIEHPLVHQLVHNGETFQVAGITNNSFLQEASEIRSCATQYEELGEHVLRVAKRRLDGMLYVGLTERHKDSAQLFANVVGRQVIARQLHGKLLSADNSTKTDSKVEGPGTNGTIASNTSKTSNETHVYETFMQKLVTSYEDCSHGLRDAQTSRRLRSFEALPLVNFTESRKTIPQDVMARILQLNSLDYELHQYAKKLFQTQLDFVGEHAEELSKLMLVKKPVVTPDPLNTAEEDERFYRTYITVVGLVIIIAFTYSVIKREHRVRRVRKSHT